MARKRRWIPVLIVIALLAAAPAFVGVAWWRARLRLQEMVRVLPEPFEKVWYAEYRRPSLFGDPLPGNAWHHYYKVGREIAASGGISDELAGILNSAYPVRFPAPADLARLRDDHRAWLDEIFAGLRCETLRRIPDSEGELFARPAFLLACAEAERQSGRDAEALRLLSAVLALSGDWRRGAHPSVVVDGFEPERYAAVLWRVVLSNHALTPADLESACRLLDRIEQVRPSLADAVRSHHEGRRATMIENYPKLADPYDEHPEWRHLWSWTFKMCELVDDLDRDTREILALEARPPWKRAEREAEMDAAIDQALKNPGRRRRPTDGLGTPANGYLREARGRSMRDLIRVATALAWYEAEIGRMPERLADLVPRYLPHDPVCAASGEPVPYAEGVLTTPEAARSGFSREAGGIDWPIRRR